MDKKIYNLMNWPDIEGIVYSESNNPKQLLGAHICRQGILIQVFRPDAVEINVIVTGKNTKYPMEKVDEAGYFAVCIPGKRMISYKLELEDIKGHKYEYVDPYQYPSQLTKTFARKFNEGGCYDVYKHLGAHKKSINGVEGINFSVYAPNAMRVSVVGDFNSWDGRIYQMTKDDETGIFEIFIPELNTDIEYKYEIKTKYGNLLIKSDPYSLHYNMDNDFTSTICDEPAFEWQDIEWIDNKSQVCKRENNTLSICELSIDDYKDVKSAKDNAKKIKELGFDFVELMPPCEYVNNNTSGYETIGYFAPSSRIGQPVDFMNIVNEFHKNGIGVLMDINLAFMGKDKTGLSEFDGAYVYEIADARLDKHPELNTAEFDYASPQVRQFLISSVLMWVEKYHIDGFRIDEVASMLYLDYGKNDGQWVPNKFGGNKNLEAVEFFKHINTLILGRNHGTVMIAEESTAWPKVTGKVEEDGLNFSYKWNMGWMHDFLDYMKLDPYFRKNNHNKMTFAMSYNESEKYILVLSHDEVVHLKCSMLNKMPGLEGDKFKNLMAGYAFMMGHCGKKLLFMGQEFAQKQEWSEERELDWYLLENPEHKKIQNWVKELLHLYRRNRCLYELDSSWEGFEWINANDADRSIFSFIRKSKDGKNNMLFVINFTPVERPDYRVGVPKHKTYQLVLDSEDPKFTGKTVQAPVKKAAKGRGKAAKQSYKKLDYKAVKSECDGRPFSFAYPLAPYGVAVFKY